MNLDWKYIERYSCDGFGVVDGYDAGPLECKVCGGLGHLWRSPKGRLADYPGGPFRGRG